MGPDVRISQAQAQQHSADLFAAVGGSRKEAGRRRRHGKRRGRQFSRL